MSQVKVMYAKHGSKFFCNVSKESDLPTLVDIKNDYVTVWKGELPESTPEKIFMKFNSEHNILRMPSRQKLIKVSGAMHTSMSVGDIVVIDNVTHVCMPFSWFSI